MYHIAKQKRKKFNPKSEEGIFIGYAENSKGFRKRERDDRRLLGRSDGGGDPSAGGKCDLAANWLFTGAPREGKRSAPRGYSRPNVVLMDRSRYQARLMIQGSSQRPGIDYTEIYSPVVRYSTVRYLMALAVQYNLDIEQMYVVTAFLHEKLKDEETYMGQAEGFVGDPMKMCRLKRAL